MAGARCGSLPPGHRQRAGLKAALKAWAEEFNLDHAATYQAAFATLLEWSAGLHTGEAGHRWCAVFNLRFDAAPLPESIQAFDLHLATIWHPTDAPYDHDLIEKGIRASFEEKLKSYLDGLDEYAGAIANDPEQFGLIETLSKRDEVHLRWVILARCCGLTAAKIKETENDAPSVEAVKKAIQRTEKLLGLPSRKGTLKRPK